MYETPSCFGPRCPIVRNCSCAEQSLGYTVIFNVREYGEVKSIDLQKFVIVTTKYFTFL